MEIHMPPKDKSICFSGYRPFKLPKRGDENSQEIKNTKKDLSNMCLNLIKFGKTNFINGLGMGFDIYAAEQIIKLKILYPYIKLITVAPFSTKYYLQWSNDWKERANEVCRLSDKAFSLSPHYNRGIYHQRNRFMVDNSTELITYFDGKKGGTKYTVQYAKHKGLEIHNICQSETQKDKATYEDKKVGRYDRVFSIIAKQNKISVSELKREMQNSINEAYKNPTPEALLVPREDEIPTLEEYMDYMIKECGAYKNQ